jgi:hypothetical protein
MDSTITIEIELPVTYTATKGYPRTHSDPGCPDEVDDIDYNRTTAIHLINAYLEDNKGEIDGILLYDANEAALQYECDKAEYKRDQMMDR